MRLSDLVRKYTTDPRYLGSPRSQETYDHCLGQFLAYLTTHGIENSVSAFTAENIEGFVAYLYEYKLSNTSINLRLAALGGLAKYGMQNQENRRYILDANPVDRIKRPRNEPVRERYLSMDELRDLIGVECRHNERLALMLIIDQPLRATEYCEAKVEDLQPAGDEVALSVRVKGNRFRTKVLGAKVAEMLTESLRQREASRDERLLLNAEGQPYTRQSLSEMIARLARRAGVTRIPVRAHVIRHSIASAAAAAGAGEREIAEMLNHSGTQNVKRYVHGVRPDAALAGVRAALGLS